MIHPKEEASDSTVDTENVYDEKEKTSPIDGKDMNELEPSKNKRKKKGEFDIIQKLVLDVQLDLKRNLHDKNQVTISWQYKNGV